MFQAYVTCSLIPPAIDEFLSSKEVEPSDKISIFIELNRYLSHALSYRDEDCLRVFLAAAGFVLEEIRSIPSQNKNELKNSEGRIALKAFSEESCLNQINVFLSRFDSTKYRCEDLEQSYPGIAVHFMKYFLEYQSFNSQNPLSNFKKSSVRNQKIELIIQRGI